jgi:hypothetical protein
MSAFQNELPNDIIFPNSIIDKSILETPNPLNVQPVTITDKKSQDYLLKELKNFRLSFKE